MRFVIAAGRSVGATAMTQAQHRTWARDLASLDADVIGFTEQWRPRYARGLRRNLPGYAFALPTWPFGNGGTGLAWHDLKVTARGGIRLHGVVLHHRRIVSGYRSLRWIQADANGYQLSLAAAHITPHPGWGGRVERAWRLGMGRVRGWARDELSRGRRVAILIDANVDHHTLVAFFGHHLDGRPVRVVSDGLCHVILIGRWAVTGHDTLPGTPSDHDPLYVDCYPRGGRALP